MITDRRGVTVDATDPPLAADPNPGLAIKAPLRVATTGTNIALSGLQTIDGVALAAGDRVLVKDQTDPTTNGIYAASTGTWNRTTDANGNTEFACGTYVQVNFGTLNAGKQFKVTTLDPIIIGTSALTFVAVNYPQSAFEWTVNGGGAAPPPGYADDFEVPFACIITLATLMADRVGNLQIDILRAPYASFPPVASICAADLPTLAAQQNSQDALLTGWTVQLAAGDVLRFKLLSLSAITRFTLSLRVTRS